MRRQLGARRGAVVVEFAFIAPILLLLMLGIIEFGRAMMVSEMLTEAARSGARSGTVISATNTSVNSAVSQCLPSISNATTTIKVNGSAGNVSTASRGDSITVQVSVPYSSVSWLPKNTFLSGTTLSATAVMDHE